MDNSFVQATRGRMPRRKYLGVFLVVNLICISLYLVFNSSGGNPFGPIGNFVLCLFFAAILAIASVERCHDRDCSGYFAALFIVPFFCLWPLIDLLFLRGTVGPNKYGPDPLEEKKIVTTSEIKTSPPTDAEIDALLIHELKDICVAAEERSMMLRKRGYTVCFDVNCDKKDVAITPKISKEF